jgi:tetratricopeptide (TPR) repeat protein
MAEIKIDTLYYMVINGIILNEKNMFGRGISRKDMSEMISLGIIEKTETDEYKFKDVEGLYQYGLKLLSLKQKKEADECFLKCYDLNPDDLNIKLQYLLNSIKHNEYQTAFKICEELASTGDYKVRRDMNLYMNLFSVFIDLEPSQALRVKSFVYKDVCLDYSDENHEENDVRRDVWLSKYTHACNLLNKLMREHGDYSVHYEIMKTLIVRALDYDRLFKIKILSLAKEENVFEIKNILGHRYNQKRLSKLENYIMLLVDAIIEMKKTGTSIKPTKVMYNNLYDAILANDFELALDLNNQFIEQNNDDPNDDILHVLLVQITELISKIRKSDSVKMIIDEIDSDNIYKLAKSLEPDDEKVIDETYIDMILRESEEMAYYIIEEKMTLDEYCKRFGLLPKYMLLIKLIYARDFYIEGDYASGDELIEQVERWSSKDSIVSMFMDEVKFNRDYYNKDDAYVRRKILN